MAAEFRGLEEQDQAELFDEDNVEGVDAPQEGATFEEIPDVYDATRRVGDENEDLGELDAADFEADAIDDEDLEEEDEVIDEDVYDETDEEDVADPDQLDQVAARGRDEVELEYQPDVDGRRGARAGAGGYESRGELDEDDLNDLGYGADEEEEEEVGDDESPDEMTNPPDFLLKPEERSFQRKSARESIDALPGCAEAEEEDLFVRAADAPLCDEACFDHIAHRMMAGEARQEALIDEAVEETFPASDPIAPKHIT